jgi:hypothetical protein
MFTPSSGAVSRIRLIPSVMIGFLLLSAASPMGLGRFLSLLVLYTEGRMPWTGKAATYTGEYKERLNRL